MSFAIEIFSEQPSVVEQLNKLHLTSEQLKTSVLKGQAARNNATENHPANAGGTMAFFEAVRGLRDELIPKGWKAENTRNLSMTVFPETSISIVVSGGTKDTGRKDGHPMTRNGKGEQAKHYLHDNQDDIFLTNKLNLNLDTSKFHTWILLYYFDYQKNELRSELSLPIDMNEQGKIIGWKKRIILGAINFDDEPIKNEIDYTPTIDIDIKRKA